MQEQSNAVLFRQAKTPKTKVCSNCRKRKLLEKFTKNNTTMSGYAGCCKKCRNKKVYTKNAQRRNNPLNNPRRIRTSANYIGVEYVGMAPKGLPLVRKFKCCVVGCKKQATDGHHLDYSEIKTKPWKNRIPLCHPHHASISIFERRTSNIAATLAVTGRTKRELRRFSKTLVTPKSGGSLN